METKEKTVTVSSTINAPVSKVWEYWNKPEHITRWAFASDDWHVPYADNDLRVGGKFKTTMAAKDGSFSFDFEGIYINVDEHHYIEYNIGDGRNVKIYFDQEDGKTKITEVFEPEGINPLDMQQTGWQTILNNFKKYVEAGV